MNNPMTKNAIRVSMDNLELMCEYPALLSKCIFGELSEQEEKRFEELHKKLDTLVDDNYAQLKANGSVI